MTLTAHSSQVIFALIVTLWFAIDTAYADILINSLQQRIGDYDVRISTTPVNPISGEETRINIMITAISNHPITDTPIIIRISSEKEELTKSEPIFLSSNHYSHNYKFDKAGIFLLRLDILDNPIEEHSGNSNRILTFDFPIHVSEPFYANIANFALPITISIAGGSFISFVLLRKLKRK